MAKPEQIKSLLARAMPGAAEAELSSYAYHLQMEQFMSEFYDSVPSKYAHLGKSASFDGITPVVNGWLQDPEPWLLFLHGDVGRGKTYLAFNVCFTYIIVWDSPALWYGVPDLLAKLRSEFDGTERTTVDTLQHFDGIVFLDDLGAEKDTEFSVQELYRIIAAREAGNRKTIITSNLDLPQIASRFNERIASRMSTGLDVRLGGPDRRLGDE